MNASDELKLDLETTVTCAEGQMAAEVGGGHLALLNLKTGIYYGLDEVGGRIWALLGKSRTVREIRDEILKEYEVEPICCERDLIKLLGELAQHQLVELRHAPHFQIQTA